MSLLFHLLNEKYRYTRYVCLELQEQCFTRTLRERAEKKIKNKLPTNFASIYLYAGYVHVRETEAAHICTCTHTNVHTFTLSILSQQCTPRFHRLVATYGFVLYHIVIEKANIISKTL